jgi:hypothetical protein
MLKEQTWKDSWQRLLTLDEPGAVHVPILNVDRSSGQLFWMFTGEKGIYFYVALSCCYYWDGFYSR